MKTITFLQVTFIGVVKPFGEHHAIQQSGHLPTHAFHARMPTTHRSTSVRFSSLPFPVHSPHYSPFEYSYTIVRDNTVTVMHFVDGWHKIAAWEYVFQRIKLND